MRVIFDLSERSPDPKLDEKIGALCSDTRRVLNASFPEPIRRRPTDGVIPFTLHCSFRQHRHIVVDAFEDLNCSGYVIAGLLIFYSELRSAVEPPAVVVAGRNRVSVRGFD